MLFSCVFKKLGCLLFLMNYSNLERNVLKVTVKSRERLLIPRIKKNEKNEEIKSQLNH